MSTINVTHEAATAVLEFNRPEALNAFDETLQVEVLAALEDFAADDRVRSVVVTGRGRAFSTGFDLSPPEEGGEHSSPVDTWKFGHETSGRFHQAFWDFPKPMIAATHGYALGGACEVAMLCDLTISSIDCKFGEPEIRLGYGSGMSILLMRLVPPKIAKELLMTGSLVDAQRAHEVGLVNHLVPEEQLMSEALRHAAVLNLIAPKAMRLIKESAQAALSLSGVDQSMAYNQNVTAILADAASGDSGPFADYAREHGVSAALKRRQSEFKSLGA